MTLCIRFILGAMIICSAFIISSPQGECAVFLWSWHWLTTPAVSHEKNQYLFLWSNWIHWVVLLWESIYFPHLREYIFSGGDLILLYTVFLSSQGLWWTSYSLFMHLYKHIASEKAITTLFLILHYLVPQLIVATWLSVATLALNLVEIRVIKNLVTLCYRLQGNAYFRSHGLLLNN